MRGACSIYIDSDVESDVLLFKPSGEEHMNNALLDFDGQALLGGHGW
jgi:hypothetical protein